jgi:ABC-type branched-subunit amino acid transport system substrate-binding protein
MLPIKTLPLLFSVLIIINLILASCGPAPYECSDPLGCLHIYSNAQVVIGTILATAGDERALGTSSLQNVKQAVTDKDNLFRHSFQLYTYSTDCTAGSAQEAATEYAINPNMVAVIGPTCIDEVGVANQILLNAGIPLLGPVRNSAQAYELTRQMLNALQQVTVRMPDGTLFIPRQALFSALNLSR